MSDTDRTTKRPKTGCRWQKKGGDIHHRRSFSCEPHTRRSSSTLTLHLRRAHSGQTRAEKKAPRRKKPRSCGGRKSPRPRSAAKPGGAWCGTLRQLSVEEKARSATALADAGFPTAKASASGLMPKLPAAAPPKEEKLKTERVAAEKSARSRKTPARPAEGETRNVMPKPKRRAALSHARDRSAAEVSRRRVNEEEEETATKKIGLEIVRRSRRPRPKKWAKASAAKGKLTVTHALEGDDERTRSVAAYHPPFTACPTNPIRGADPPASRPARYHHSQLSHCF